VTCCGLWHPSLHCIFPVAFKQAASAFLLINSCRGFGGVQGGGEGGDAAGRRITRRARLANSSGGSSSSRGGGGGGSARRRGVQLPQEVVAHILCRASFPVAHWVPQLHPFLTPEDWESWGAAVRTA
jgi:hypothetical protein